MAHICKLRHPPVSETGLYIARKYNNILYKLIRLSDKNPKTSLYFRSKHDRHKEIKRHLGILTRHVIHPLSIFRFVLYLFDYSLIIT